MLAHLFHSLERHPFITGAASLPLAVASWLISFLEPINELLRTTTLAAGCFTAVLGAVVMGRKFVRGHSDPKP